MGRVFEVQDPNKQEQKRQQIIERITNDSSFMQAQAIIYDLEREHNNILFDYYDVQCVLNAITNIFIKNGLTMSNHHGSNYNQDDDEDDDDVELTDSFIISGRTTTPISCLSFKIPGLTEWFKYMPILESIEKLNNSSQGEIRCILGSAIFEKGNNFHIAIGCRQYLFHDYDSSLIASKQLTFVFGR